MQSSEKKMSVVRKYNTEMKLEIIWNLCNKLDLE